MANTLRDLRHAVRLLLQSKTWTLMVVLSLALGIGANTAIFSAVNGLVLQTLPGVDRPDTLVRLLWVGENDMGNDFNEYGPRTSVGGRELRSTFPPRIFQEFRAANRTLDDLFACAPQGQVNVVTGNRAEVATALIATGNYFTVLGVHAIAGRTFTPDDDRPGAPAVAVLSHGYWQRRFGGDRGVVGRVLTINNVPVTVVGVTPPEFTGVQQVMTDARDITLPLSLDPQFGGASPLRPDGTPSGAPPRLERPTWWWLEIVGRLKPGVTAVQVQGNLGGVFQEASRDGWSMFLSALSEQERSVEEYQNRINVPELRVMSARQGVYDVSPDTYRAMALLSVVVVLVLLIVCANVANLLLSRAAGRQRELSVRLSMGASRGRLVRQLLTESLLLALVGGLVGLVVGYWARALLPASLGTNLSLDWRVFAFVAALTLATGVAFGIAPALRASRVDIAGALKDGARGVAGGRSRLSRSLLVAQVAISLVLVVGAGLFLRTVQNLRRVDVGFDTGNLLLVPVNPVLNRYDQPRIVSLYGQMLDRLASTPGVHAASLSNPPMLSGASSSTSIYVQGRPSPPRTRENNRDRSRNTIYRVVVSPSFFETMGIRLADGRGFTDRDNRTAPKVAIINDEAARRFFPNERPIGQRFGSTLETSADLEIVGVLQNAKYDSLRDAAPPTMYVPYPQARIGAATFELRTALDPMAVVPAVRETIRQIDPNLPILNVTTQTEQIERRFAQEKVFAQAYALFGGLALLVAAIGLFGLMSYSVARRTNEIGIRMALGADRGAVRAMVLRESLVLVFAGVGIGLAAALAAGQLVAKLLFGLAPTDVSTLASAVVVMVVVSLLAGYLPARAASQVDPMIALRYE
jgi:predicted permease